VTEEEVRTFARQHAEELAAPIVYLVGKVIARGIQGHLHHAAELQLRINELEATIPRTIQQSLMVADPDDTPLETGEGDAR
jgi:hypothetical protein